MISATRTIDLGTLRRFDRPGPRYTSYPTAVEFDESVDAETYRSHLAGRYLAARVAAGPTFSRTV